MPAFTGDGFQLQVNTTGVTFVVVADMNRYERATRRNNTTFAVFANPIAYSIPGAREITYTVSGFLSDTDVGQAALFTAEQANDPIAIQVLFDGTNGFEQEVLVGSTTHSASPEGLQELSYEFSAVAAATIVGTGPLI